MILFITAGTRFFGFKHCSLLCHIRVRALYKITGSRIASINRSAKILLWILTRNTEQLVVKRYLCQRSHEKIIPHEEHIRL